LPVRLFVGNLSYDATEADLRELFAAVGQPTRIMVPVDRETGRPRGFAFVEFPEREVAEEAIRRFNLHGFKGRPLAVSEARPREEGGSRPPSGFAPRPASGGFAPRPGRPMEPGGIGAPSRGDRNFGPPAPPRRARGGPGKRQQYKEKGPKGPIREKTTGRFYNVDDDAAGEEPADLDNFATSAADDVAGEEPVDLENVATSAADDETDEE